MTRLWILGVDLGNFDKQFVKNTRKKGPTRKILDLFLLDTLKTIFFNVKPKDWHRTILSKIRSLFSVLKAAGLASPLCTLVTRLWVCLNVHQYPSICLNMLENAWINSSDYARILNILRCRYDNIIIVTNVIAVHKCGRDCWVRVQVCGRNLAKSAKFEPLLTRSSHNVFLLMGYG